MPDPVVPRSDVETITALREALTDEVLTRAHAVYESAWRHDFCDRRNHSSDKAHAAGLLAFREALAESLEPALLGDHARTPQTCSTCRFNAGDDTENGVATAHVCINRALLDVDGGFPCSRRPVGFGCNRHEPASPPVPEGRS